jgi:NitT/TauT family transport system ATP-binding protein
LSAALQSAAPRVHARPSTRGAIVIDDVSKIYDPKGEAVLAVDHCSLTIAPGEICMIVGPSGCGKTTLLNAIAGFHEIDTGTITLDGDVLCDAKKPKADPGSDRVVVFQNGALFPWKTNLENVAFGPIVQRKLSKSQATDKARAMMQDAGLASAMNGFPGEISSGTRRRVEIVRALMNDPKVLLMDEPYRALDSLTRSVMHQALLETHSRNPVTMFFITHDLEEAIYLGHRVVIMTTRPCKPKKLITVDLEQPRVPGIVTSKAFRSLLAETREAIHEEALEAFRAGEREG